MWPMHVDYTDDECKRVLRSLELEAYASVINAFRAQGFLSKERRKMLQELCSVLSISLERHRAEIRRAVNDEHLNTIAERLCGPNTATEWAIEGRRLVPLMPRLVPQTVFTAIANSAATAQAAKNATLPMPGKTGLRENGENDAETMISRKRKEQLSDTVASPSKYVAVDNQFANTLCNLENINTLLTEIAQPSSDAPIPDSSGTLISSTTQVLPPLPEYNPLKNAPLTMSSATASISPIKSPKHIMVKPASTITTFSSFDQLASNIISSKSVSSSHMPAVAHEEQVSTSDSKSVSSDIQSIARLSQPSCTIKTPSVTAGMSSSTASSITFERFPIASSSSPSGSKFLTHVRPKNPPQVRQPTPASLGLKIHSSCQMGQRSVSPKATNMKAKQDAAPPLASLPKKQMPTTSTLSSDSQGANASPVCLNESLSTLKSSLPATKSSVTKSECSSTSNQSILQQPSTKVTTLPKTFHKPVTHGSQFVARTLFSSAAKTGAKSLPPVIFNVSTTPCTPIQTTAKTTMPGQSETTKVGLPTPQLLPKSTAGISHNQFKLSTSNSPTIQYRNEGGMVRSARIVNISQQGGSRLPCAISPSAISALGLSPNLTSTALRVTLPAGTLNTSSAIRVSAAAKPNVIVVHKAQMWPRTQGAVIMSSTGSIPRFSSDNMQEAITLSQKQEKNRQIGNKVTPRPIAPASQQLPTTSLKVHEANSSLAALGTKGLQVENLVQPDSTSTKTSENLNDIKCKRNLLADVIEASGILTDALPEKNSKKDLEKKDSHKLKTVSEPGVSRTTDDANAVTTSDDVSSSASMQGINTEKLEIRAASPSLLLLPSQSSKVGKKDS